MDGFAERAIIGSFPPAIYTQGVECGAIDRQTACALHDAR